MHSTKYVYVSNTVKLLVVSQCTARFNIKTSVDFPHKYVAHLSFSVILTLHRGSLQLIHMVTFVVEPQFVFFGVENGTFHHFYS